MFVLPLARATAVRRRLLLGSAFRHGKSGAREQRDSRDRRQKGFLHRSVSSELSLEFRYAEPYRLCEQREVMQFVPPNAKRWIIVPP